YEVCVVQQRKQPARLACTSFPADLDIPRQVLAYGVEPAETGVLLRGLLEDGFQRFGVVASQLSGDFRLETLDDREVHGRVALQLAQMSECFAVPVAELRYVGGDPG